jgi:hypothetical protein
VGTRSTGSAGLPYRVFGVFDDVKRDNVRMDIRRDGFGARGDYSKTHLCHVRGNDDYYSAKVYGLLSINNKNTQFLQCLFAKSLASGNVSTA